MTAPAATTSMLRMVLDAEYDIRELALPDMHTPLTGTDVTLARTGGGYVGTFGYIVDFAAKDLLADGPAMASFTIEDAGLTNPTVTGFIVGTSPAEIHVATSLAGLPFVVAVDVETISAMTF